MNQELTCGKYYLGDPSFVLPEKIYHGLWGNLYNYDNGKYILNDCEFAVHNTHKGDGIFSDTKNRQYLVDSGVLALISMDLIDDIKLCKNGYIFNFDHKINFIYDAGTFYVKSGKKFITIDTRDMDIYDSDYEEHFKNDDDENIGKTINNDSDTDSIQDENEELFLDDGDCDNNDNVSIPIKKNIFFR